MHDRVGALEERDVEGGPEDVSALPCYLVGPGRRGCGCGDGVPAGFTGAAVRTLVERSLTRR